MQYDTNHELDSLREIKDILMRLWPGKIVMGTFTVFVSTKYGDVKVMTDKTEFPYSSRYLFRKDMPVEEYCSYIVSDIEDYSMSLNEMKNMIETAYKGKIQFQLTEYKCYLRLQTTNGEAFFNRELVYLSGYGQKFYRKDKSLEKFCSFIISGIDKYSVVPLKNKLAEICTCDIELDERNHLIHLKTEYGNAIADAGTVRYSDYPFVLHRSRMNTAQFAIVGFLASISYQFLTGSWLAMIVDFLQCLSSISSIKSSNCCPSSIFIPKSSMISRSSAAILSKNRAALDSILAICISSRSFCILAYLTLYPAKQA